MIGKNNDTKLRFYWDSADRIVDSATISTGQWYHIAVARSSGTTKMFKNGTQIGSDYSDTNNYTSSVLEIGQRSISDGLEFDGKLSNVRVVLGTAVYTSNFTTPTEPLTAISGTELLICTENNLEDEGPNNIAFTVKGNPQVLSSSPFTGNTGEGGLTWIKSRTNTGFHFLFDTERGSEKALSSELTNGEISRTGSLTAFNSNGFSVGSFAASNGSGQDYVSWTFRAAKKFFDVVTYTGNGTAGRSISHNLGGTVGTLIIKRTDNTSSWIVWHRSTSSSYLFLNGTDAATSGTISNVSSTAFTIESVINTSYNASGGTYVAYLFAHNNNDGEFGPDTDQDVIKCGSYTGTGSSQLTVDLGFEPQWLLVKRTDTAKDWILHDTMRGFGASGNYTSWLEPNTSDAEATATADWLELTSTGFSSTSNQSRVNASGGTYIYMAIRRGPLAAPDDATKVFHVDRCDSDNTQPYVDAPFPVDFGWWQSTTGGSAKTSSRLTQGQHMLFRTTSAESANSNFAFDYMNGWYASALSTNHYGYSWKRAPSYFDVVAYKGTSPASGDTKSHNLGVVPEMIWVKNRDGVSGGARPWIVYHKDTGNTGYLKLNETSALITSDPESKFGNGTVGVSPTASSFTVAGDYEVNYSTDSYIAYLFATVAGVSKVGSYTGNGTNQNIDCGFSSGARFVLIKRTDSSTSGEWYVFDTVRGIVSGNDSTLYLNYTDAADTSLDIIDPYSGGFNVNNNSGRINTNTASYIFYAIA